MELDLLKTPGPTITALTAPFWLAAQEGRLSIQRCETCEKGVFYPRNICPHCWGNRLTWVDTSGWGRLKSYSIVYKPGHPGWLPIAPYIVGLVELDEGPTMLSLILHAANEPPQVDSPMMVTPTRIGGRTLPAFQQTKACRV